MPTFRRSRPARPAPKKTKKPAPSDLVGESRTRSTTQTPMDPQLAQALMAPFSPLREHVAALRAAAVPPFDLSPLPEGFRAAVVRAYSPHAHPWPLDSLAFAIGDAWRNSTTKQRLAAEAGVCQVMTSALEGADQRSASYVVGVFGASCIDLELSRVVDVAAMDPEAVLCGVFDAGGLRVAEDVRGVLAHFMEAAHERTIKMRAFAGAIDRGDVPGAPRK